MGSYKKRSEFVQNIRKNNRYNNKATSGVRRRLNKIYGNIDKITAETNEDIKSFYLEDLSKAGIVIDEDSIDVNSRLYKYTIMKSNSLALHNKEDATETDKNVANNIIKCVESITTLELLADIKVEKPFEELFQLAMDKLGNHTSQFFALTNLEEKLMTRITDERIAKELVARFCQFIITEDNIDRYEYFIREFTDCLLRFDNEDPINNIIYNNILEVIK